MTGSIILEIDLSDTTKQLTKNKFIKQWSGCLEWNIESLLLHKYFKHIFPQTFAQVIFAYIIPLELFPRPTS